MIVADGWKSPSAVFGELYREECAIDGRGVDLRRRCERAFYEFLFHARSAAILMPDGRLILVDWNFLGRVVSVSPFHHRYFDPSTGEVGATSLSTFEMTKWRLRDGFRYLRSARAMLLWFGAAMIATVLLAIFIISPLALWMAERVGFGMMLFAALVFEVFLILMFFRPAFFARRKWRRNCRAYAGGHLIFRDGAVSDFIRARYRDEEAELQQAMSGRPKHPAFAWYEARAFRRSGMTIKDLQAAMPKDDKGDPPAASTIRDWEKNHQQKPPAVSLQKLA